MLLSGELMYPLYNTVAPWAITYGEQNTNQPLMSYWNSMYRALRECNIFLENIDNVPDLESFERDAWVGEVKFLKAYYHFWLLQLYGPIPIVKDNIPIYAQPEDVRVSRAPVDEVVNYIVELLDESIALLPDLVRNETSELGRITKPIAAGIKARVLVYAASPLFNGNTDYQGYNNKDGTPLFNTTYVQEKWERAAVAAKEAIDLAESLNYELYTFTETQQARNLSTETKLKLNTRVMFTERWNREIIWANTNTNSDDLQRQATPRGLDPAALGNSQPRSNFSTSYEITQQFYSKNGVPITEDVEWSYGNRYQLRTATYDERYYIKDGYVTAEYNFEREPRFYATYGFDGGIWYGQGRYDEANSFYIMGKVKQTHGKTGPGNHTITGYFPKKYIHYTNVMTATGNVYSVERYPWIMLRLAELYLLYAEAANEAYGPGAEIFQYLDLVRARAGLGGVVESWSTYSRFPNKPQTKEGLREIIRQERNIELALEGHYYFDQLRWKTAMDLFNGPISGWDIDQEMAESYYRERVIRRRVFSLRDYFWPIREYDLIVNKNLVQSPGW